MTNGLVEAALARMAEEGPTWTTADRERWCEMFADIVAYVYPGRKPRKSRAKASEEEQQ